MENLNSLGIFPACGVDEWILSKKLGYLEFEKILVFSHSLFLDDLSCLCNIRPGLK